MKRIVCFAAFVLLAGCGGARQALPHGGTIRQRVTIKIDVPKSAAAARRPQYVSAATTQMVVDVQTGCPANCSSVNGYPQTVALTPTSGGCSSTLADTYCQLALSLAPGNYTATLTAEDQNTSALSAAQGIAFTVAAGQNNTIAVSLGGIPASIVFVPNANSALSGNNANGYTLNSCTPQSVSVLTTDADGDYIIGPGAPAVTLTSSSDNVLVGGGLATAPNAFWLRCLAPDGATSQLTAGAVPQSTTGTSVISAEITVTTQTRNLAGTISEYAVPTGNASPYGIAAGPDGAMWFTEESAGKIGRISSSGTFSEYRVPGGASPTGIAAGPDGSLWFADINAGIVARITTAGNFSEYAAPQPTEIAEGPDGAMWFGEFTPNKICRITMSGAITEYPIPTSGSDPEGITAGPDGALWFVEDVGNKIGRITTSGNITEYPVPTGASNPTDIAAGPDGALWFTEASANKIGRITTAGVITEFSVSSGTADIAAGPDGALWFTEENGNKVGRITTAGAITEYALPTFPSEPLGIAAGPDGALWFAELGDDKIGRLQ